jgi:ribosome-binding factor A
MQKVNDLLIAELARELSRLKLIEDGLITITYVKCSPNLREASIGISVLPENRTGTALRALRKQNSYFKKTLKKLNLKYVPNLNWQVDSLVRRAAEFDEAIKKIED